MMMLLMMTTTMMMMMMMMMTILMMMMTVKDGDHDADDHDYAGEYDTNGDDQP